MARLSIGRLALVSLLSLPAAVLAGCPNQCSGHGSCGASDVCACYANWQGSDCSLRTCPFGKSWGFNSADPHDYSECSGQGICDRTAGECSCFSGFTGRACARSECPNDCSGNGVCKLIGDLSDSLAIPYASSNWDSDRIQTCICDNGFFGPDCSQRYCPTGDDPLTACASVHTQSFQEIRFTLGSAVKWDPTRATLLDVASSPVAYGSTDEAMDLFGSGVFTTGTFTEISTRATTPAQLRVTYYDQYNGTYTAHGVGNVLALATATQSAKDALEVALESLPLKKVKNVVVSSALTSASSNSGINYVLQRRYVVTFIPDTTTSANVGVQNALQCDSAYSCSEAGCQPHIAMPFLYRYAGMDTDISVGTQLVTVGTTGAGNIQFYTGDANTNAAWALGKFIRLHSISQPQMPFNVPVDAGVTATNLARYDVRILIAVIDPKNNLDDTNDLVYVRVIAGHQNITSNLEAVGFAGWPAAPAHTGVWGSVASTTYGGSVSPASLPAKSWTTTLSGFTPLGPIVPDTNGDLKMVVPGAPGVYVYFGATNIVHNDGKGRWYEITLKLPTCSVSVLETAGQFTDISGNALAPVDSQVENVECSNRGLCDRSTAQCSCFQGFFGPACQRQTILV